MAQAHAEEVRPHGNDKDAPEREIDRLFDAHAVRVRSLCRYLLGSHDTAEDAVSEVYLKARQTRASYDPSQSFVAWITTIARHHCFDLLRRRRVETRLFSANELDADALPETTTSAANAPLAQLLTRESRQALRAAIERLPERYRLALVLRYYEDLSYDQIAAELGATRQDVATLLFRAKQKLRTALASATTVEGT